MVAFNPQTQVDLGGNTTSASQGTGSSADALKTLFEGVAEAVHSGVQSYDTQTRQDIAQTSAKEINSIVSPGLPAEDTTPDEIKKGIVKANNLVRANQEGVRTDMQVYADMTVLSKKLKLKYPGYVDLIDDQIVGAFTSSPANRLRQEYLTQQATASTAYDLKMKDRREYLQANQKYLPMGQAPDAFDITDDKAYFTVQAGVATNAQQDYRLEKQQNLLKASEVDDKYQANQLMKTLKPYIVTKANQATWAAIGPEWERRKAEGLLDRPLNPQEQAQWAIQFASLKAEVESKVNTMANDPAYVGKISEDQRKELKTAALDQLETYNKLVTSGTADSAGILHVLEQSNKLAVAGKESEMLKGQYGPLVARVEYMTKLGWAPQVQAELIASYVGPMNAVQQQKDAEGLMFAMLPATDPAFEAGGAFEQWQKHGIATPEVSTKVIDSWVTQLQMPNLPPDARDQAVKGIFGEENTKLLQQFTNLQSQESVFNRLVSPQVTANLKDTKEFGTYAEWAQKQFLIIGQGNMQTIAEVAVRIGPEATITYDEKTHHFVPKLDPSKLPAKESIAGGFLRGNIAASQRYGQVQSDYNVAVQAINSLNRYADRMVPIYEAIGIDPDEGLKNLYSRTLPSQLLKGNLPSQMMNELQGAGSDEELKGSTGADALEFKPTRKKGVYQLTPEDKQAVVSTAQDLGTTPQDLLTVISYETGGTYNPGIVGGKNNLYQGLIQMGPSERKQYGFESTFSGQLQNAAAFLKDRGFKPGMSILDLYSTINAGSPGLYRRSDRKGATVSTHVRDMLNSRHRTNAYALLGLPYSDG